MNNRTEIRSAIVDRLGSLTSDAKSVPVFNARYLPLKPIPAVIVKTGGDVSEKSTDEQANRREEVVQIEVYMEGLEDHEDLESGELSVADKLDLLTGQIETVFSNEYESLIVAGVPTVDRLNYGGTVIKDEVDGSTFKLKGIMVYTAFVNEQLIPLVT